MIKYIECSILLLFMGCAAKTPANLNPLTDNDFNLTNEVGFTQRTISGTSNIDYTEPLFIFFTILGVVLISSFFPLFLMALTWSYKKILTLFKK